MGSKGANTRSSTSRR